MKKILSVLFLLVLIILCPAHSLAANDESTDGIKIYVDKERVISENQPVIENSRTLAPIRAVAEKAGISVTWDSDSRTVTLSYDFYTVKLTVGSTQMTVYNSVIDSLEKVQLDAEPKIINSSTYITLRAALEAVGAKVEWDGETRSIYVTSPNKIRQELVNTEDSNNTEENSPIDQEKHENNLSENEKKDKEDNKEDNKQGPAEEITTIRFTGFREMQNNEITEGEPHGLYGRILTKEPITAVRCRITDTEYDAQLRFKASDNLTNYNVFTYFDKHICFSDAGLGEHTLEIYATVRGEKPKLVFSYDYTVVEKQTTGEAEDEENAENDEETENFDDETDKTNETNKKDEIKETEESEESKEEQEIEEEQETEEEQEAVPVISYYGFRKMSDDKITEGAPHGLYGNVVSNVPLTSVRCRIDGTEMDYTVELDKVNEILSYSVFSYFDKLICFSDAGLGKQTFKIYASAVGKEQELIFSYSYTVTEKEDTSDSESNNDTGGENDEEDEKKTADYQVCLPLKGEIELTSPYGFRAYNKWEFHKGIDIISSVSLDILAVADGVVVDCKKGINSGAGNYVALQHEGGWVSLYYHLKSYNVKKGDKVKMGQIIAIMGNSGGRYGVHLHFMTCDNWYGTLWATQNSHHTAPHEYVPQILSAVEYYNPQYEKENKDKVIICDFNFPSQISFGKPHSISRGDGHFAFEGEYLESVNVTVTDKDGAVLLSETETEPKVYTDGYYYYSNVSAKLDKMCKFDELPLGKMTLYISAVTSDGRERVVYTKEFEVKESAAEEAETETATEAETETETETESESAEEKEPAESPETENIVENAEKDENLPENGMKKEGISEPESGISG